ncbi:hypothetical protein HDU97_010104 [Phlyctochytrium planicorne]|nr:hypothetical protein HDU97_010104 [Phlyctochytrium planicorne]
MRFIAVLSLLALGAPLLVSAQSSAGGTVPAPAAPTTAAATQPAAQPTTAGPAIPTATTKAEVTTAVTTVVTTAAQSSVASQPTKSTGTNIVTSDAQQTNVETTDTPEATDVPATNSSNQSKSNNSISPETLKILIIVGSVAGAIILCAMGTLFWNKCIKRESTNEKPPFLQKAGASRASPSEPPSRSTQPTVPQIDMMPVDSAATNANRRSGVPLPSVPSDGPTYINETVGRSSMSNSSAGGMMNAGPVPPMPQGVDPYGYNQGYQNYYQQQQYYQQQYQGQPDQYYYQQQQQQQQYPYQGSYGQQQGYWPPPGSHIGSDSGAPIHMGHHDPNLGYPVAQMQDPNLHPELQPYSTEQTRKSTSVHSREHQEPVV